MIEESRGPAFTNIDRLDQHRGGREGAGGRPRDHAEGQAHGHPAKRERPDQGTGDLIPRRHGGRVGPATPPPCCTRTLQITRRIRV